MSAQTVCICGVDEKLRLRLAGGLRFEHLVQGALHLRQRGQALIASVEVLVEGHQREAIVPQVLARRYPVRLFRAGSPVDRIRESERPVQTVFEELTERRFGHIRLG